MSAKAAPDVDLRRQDLPQQLVVGCVALVIGLFLYFRFGSSNGEAAEPDAEQEEVQLSFARWFFGWLLKGLLQMVVGGALLLLGILVARQRSILYVPVPPGTMRSPRDNPRGMKSPVQIALIGGPNVPFEDVRVMTEDGVRIHGWFLYHADEAERYTIIYFHGNAGNIGHRMENMRDMYCELNVNIFIIDYRGYGDSEDGGGPSEAGFLKDAHASYKWLVDRASNPTEGGRVNADRILIFGRSIGGVVGIRLFANLLRLRLSRSPEAVPLPAGIILENSFTSLSDMAVQVFPFLSFLRPLLRSPIIFDEWRGAEELRFLARSYPHWCCCLLSGLQDQIVPPAQMMELYTIVSESRPAVLKFFKFPDGGHNDTPQRGGKDYWNSFRKYMELVETSQDERVRARDEAFAALG